MASKLSTIAKWNDTNTEVFWKVCVEEIEAGNRPHTHFTKEGWNNIVDKFNQKTGYKYEKRQMKNRWDSLKQEFGIWARLVDKATGLGWDPVKQTIDASPEWWDEKGKENPKNLNWKDQGPKFLDLMERCFKDVVETGSLVYKPPMYHASPEERNDQNESDDALFHATQGDSNADRDLLDDINDTPDFSNNMPRKRKRGRQADKRGGAANRLQSSLDRLVDSINESSVAPLPPLPPKPEDPFSMSKCIHLLDSVPGIEQNGPLYIFAIRIMRDRINRETFVTFMEAFNVNAVIPWLNSFSMDDVRNYK